MSSLRLAFLLAASGSFCSHGANDEAIAMKSTRPSVLAGSWYEANPERLAESVDAHLSRGQPLEKVARGLPVAIIAPHAGHQWSGDAAGHAYRLLAGAAARTIERVILIGPSHRYALNGAAITPFAEYETPLGKVPIDEPVVRALSRAARFDTLRAADAAEHCLEIQLPFLQRALRHPLHIVPILIGQAGPAARREIATAIAPYVDARTLIVISSDFTHFGGRFGYVPFRDDVDVRLRRLDRGALEAILRRDAAGLAEYEDSTGITACGINPIGILLEMLQTCPALKSTTGKPPEGRVLEYYRSADLTGDLDGSVSYAAVAFFRGGDLLPGPDFPDRLANLGAAPESSSVPEGCMAPDKSGEQTTRPPAEASSCVSPSSNASEPARFNEAERKYLLALARATIQSIVTESGYPARPAYPASVSAERMEEPCGVFVTLTENERLRGCIGSITGTRPLVDAVIENAANSATRDPRFPPVSPAEIRKLHIEISVLTPLRRVAGPDEVEIGRHGIVLSCRGHRAVFLPQVAPEQGWNRETTLDHLAVKAGLPPSAWREPGACFDVFEAIVFEE